MTAPSPKLSRSAVASSPLPPATRVAKPGHATVSVSQVDRLNSEEPATLPHPDTVTHPSLIYLPRPTPSSQVRDMEVTAHLPDDEMTTPKRHRLHPALPDDCLLPDLVARSRSSTQEWHAEPAHHEMNSEFFVLLRNRRTNKSRLIQLAAVYRMRRRPKGGSSSSPLATGMELDGSSSEENDESEERAGDNLTYAERRKMLLSGFGGRKAQLRMRRYTRDRITDEKVDEKTAKTLKKAAHDMNERDLAQGIDRAATQTTEQSAPPHDSSATAPHEAYPLLGLVSPSEFTSLEAEATALLEGVQNGEIQFENPGWRPLVWDVLRAIVSEVQLAHGLRMQRVQAAMYLHYLLVLASVDNLINLKQQAAMLDEMAVSEDVLEAILERFTSPSRHSRGKGHSQLREKCTGDKTRIANYAILMWVTAKGFTNCGGLDQLSVEIGMSAKLLASYAISMALKVQRHKGSTGPESYRLSLKVPLKFPQLRKKQGRPQARG